MSLELSASQSRKVGRRTTPGTAAIDVVSATRLDEHSFWTKSPLGRSLKRLEFDSALAWSIYFENKEGLPSLYNERIDRGDEDLVVFVHDDVWLLDPSFSDRVAEGCSRFDVIGVAGCLRRSPRQLTWLYRSEGDDPTRPPVQISSSEVSGMISHGQGPFTEISYYGPFPTACDILDGVFLAARRSALRRQGVRFDPRFKFHFYDLDFCRSSREQGLSLATWPISLSHESEGGYKSASWQEAAFAYLNKWEGSATVAAPSSKESVS